ncbi:MAG: hypothetical protein HUU22_15055 [Phycisphaerae bacterium]|nr:hypothetical protein [Phycisphaerae bacterium]NUQ47341.1 hypothetical protein [Phycisphaerae bacterium]
MESIVFTVLRRRAFIAGDAFELLGDSGSGMLDIEHPLSAHPIPFWEGRPPHEGHLLHAHVSGGHLDFVAPDGHLSGIHLADDHLLPAAALTWPTRPMYFGLFAFAARAVDRRGSRGGLLSPVVSRLVNSSPRPAETLVKTGFDEISRRLSFSFVPSPDL